MRPTLLLLALAAGPAQHRSDLGTVGRIKTEAFDRSRVMDFLYQITEAHGPRLTWSPGYEEAANWAMAELRSMASPTSTPRSGSRLAAPGRSRNPPSR
jgi:carboxypeptidase Q